MTAFSKLSCQMVSTFQQPEPGLGRPPSCRVCALAEPPVTPSLGRVRSLWWLPGPPDVLPPSRHRRARGRRSTDVAGGTGRGPPPMTPPCPCLGCRRPPGRPDVSLPLVAPPAGTRSTSADPSLVSFFLLSCFLLNFLVSLFISDPLCILGCPSVFATQYFILCFFPNVCLFFLLFFHVLPLLHYFLLNIFVHHCLSE